MKMLAAFAVVILLSAQAIAAAGQRPEYLDSYNPAAGFKPAQRNLTEIFLQIAGSLEHHGTPEPYLRHAAREQTRIEALYKANGKSQRTFRPAHFTDTYLEKLAKNWNFLSPKLGLESYAKEVGHMMRDAIKGTRGTGTIVIDIFNAHQQRVFDRMAGKGGESSDFEALKDELAKRLDLGKANVNEERYEMARRDAVSFALGIEGATTKLMQKVDQTLPPAGAERVKLVLKSIILDIGQMAQSELEAGIGEWALPEKSNASR